jgi:hypothetical protein
LMIIKLSLNVKAGSVGGRTAGRRRTDQGTF